MLAQMGAALQLEPDAPLPKDHPEISELQTARTGLIKAATQAKNQLAQQTLPMVRNMTRARIRQIEGQIAKLDAEIDTRIAACPKRVRKVQILQSIPPQIPLVSGPSLLGQFWSKCQKSGHSTFL